MGDSEKFGRRRFLKIGGTLAGMAVVGGGLAACGDTATSVATSTAATTTNTAATTTAAPALGAAMTTAAATTSAATNGQFAGRTLTIFVYSGLTEDTYRNVFAPAFEKATGAKVVLSPGWWDSVAKIKSSPNDQPPFDLVETDPTQGFPAIRESLFQKIDLSTIPNGKAFAPQILNSSIYTDSWGLPFISSAMTLCWNKDLVPSGLQKWSDLFSDGLKGKIMLYNAYYMSLYTFAVAKVEMDGKPGTAKAEMQNNLDGVLQFAKDKRDWVKYWWPTTDDAVNALLQKNVSAGNIHGNGLITPVQQNKPIGFTVPQNDQAYVQLFFVVPATSKNKDLAEAAINFFASPEMQKAFGAQTGQLAVNIPNIASEVAQTQPVWAQVYPHTADQFANLSYYPYDVMDKNSDKISKFWDSQVLRSS